jgi:hypothetical protein
MPTGTRNQLCLKRYNLGLVLIFWRLYSLLGTALGPEVPPLDSAGDVDTSPDPSAGSAPVHHGTTTLRYCTLRIGVIPCHFCVYQCFLLHTNSSSNLKKAIFLAAVAIAPAEQSAFDQREYPVAEFAEDCEQEDAEHDYVGASGVLAVD